MGKKNVFTVEDYCFCFVGSTPLKSTDSKYHFLVSFLLTSTLVTLT